MSSAIDIVKRALSILRVYSQEQPLQANDRNNGVDRLNDLIQSWQAQYNHLWTMTEAVVLMEKGKRSYQAGETGDRIVDYDQLTVTASTTALIGSETVITAGSATNISVDDNIGLELDSGAYHWTTVASISGNDITINDAIPSAASAGNTLYAYESVIDRPLRVIQARYSDVFNGSEIPLEKWSRDQYFEQPDKVTEGSGSAFYYSPQLVNGNLYIWPVAPSNNSVSYITYVRPFVITNSNAETVDFPAEWISSIAYNLAKDLMDEYGVPQDRQAMIEAKANEKLGNNLSFDNPAEGLKIELRRYY